MEEKERFELFGEHCIKDNSPDARCQLLNAYVACVILNEQDKRIKELEEENQQLKQSQKQIAIDELEKLKDTMFKEAHLSEEITFVEWLYDNYLDNQIKQLKEGK